MAQVISKIMGFVFAAIAMIDLAHAGFMVQKFPQSPPLGRPGATVVKLGDGTQLVIGGRDSSGKAITDIDKVDIKTWKIVSHYKLPAPLDTHSSLVLPSGDVLIVGSTSAGEDASPLTFLLDPAQGAWKKVSNPEIPRIKPCLSMWEDKVLAVGGEADVSTPTSLTEVLDLTSGKWSHIRAPKHAWRHPTCTRLKSGNLVVIGGGDPAYGILDAQTDEWTEKQLDGRPSEYPQVFALEDGRYLVNPGEAAPPTMTVKIFSETSEKFDSLAIQFREDAPRETKVSMVKLEGSTFLAAFTSKSESWFASLDVATKSHKLLGLPLVAGRPAVLLALDDERAFFTDAASSHALLAKRKQIKASWAWPHIGGQKSNFYAHPLTAGEVLLFGGDRNGKPLASVDLLTSKGLEHLEDLPYPLTRPIVQTMANGNLLFIGGGKGEGRSRTFIYDVNRKKSIDESHLSVPRYFASAASMRDGSVVVLGGFSAEPMSDDDGRLELVKWQEDARPWTFVTEVEAWSPNTKSWETVSRLAEPRIGAIAIPVGDSKVLVTGGFTRQGPGEWAWAKSTEIVDIAAHNSTPSPTPSLRVAFPHIGGSQKLGWVLAGGLQLDCNQPTCSGVRATAAAFNLDQQGSVRALAYGALPHPLVGAASSISSNGFLTLVGGSRKYGNPLVPTNEVQVLHSSLAAWFSASELSEARTEHAFVLLPSNTMLVMGGRGEKEQLSTVESTGHPDQEWASSPAAAVSVEPQAETALEAEKPVEMAAEPAQVSAPTPAEVAPEAPVEVQAPVEEFPLWQYGAGGLVLLLVVAFIVKKRRNRSAIPAVRVPSRYASTNAPVGARSENPFEAPGPSGENPFATPRPLAGTIRPKSERLSGFGGFDGESREAYGERPLRLQTNPGFNLATAEERPVQREPIGGGEVVIALINSVLVLLLATDLQLYALMKMKAVGQFPQLLMGLLFINIGLAFASIAGALPFVRFGLALGIGVAGAFPVMALHFMGEKFGTLGAAGGADERNAMMGALFAAWAVQGLFAFAFGGFVPKMFARMSETLLSLTNKERFSIFAPPVLTLVLFVGCESFLSEGSPFYTARITFTGSSEALASQSDDSVIGPEGDLPEEVYKNELAICKAYPGLKCEQLFANLYKDMRWCPISKGTRDSECTMKVALQAKSATVCSSVAKPDLQAQCLSRKAAELRKPELCDQLPRPRNLEALCKQMEPQLRALCLGEIKEAAAQIGRVTETCKRGAQPDPQACLDWTAPGLQPADKAECLIRHAIASGNAELCAKISKIGENAYLGEDEALCKAEMARRTLPKMEYLANLEKIDYEAKDDGDTAGCLATDVACLTFRAQDFRDPRLCLKYKEPKPRELCFGLMAVEYGDKTLCQRLESKEAKAACLAKSTAK